MRVGGRSLPFFLSSFYPFEGLSGYSWSAKLSPRSRVIVDVSLNIRQCDVIANDMFIIIALPHRKSPRSRVIVDVSLNIRQCDVIANDMFIIIALPHRNRCHLSHLINPPSSHDLKLSTIAPTDPVRRGAAFGRSFTPFTPISRPNATPGSDSLINGCANG